MKAETSPFFFSVYLERGGDYLGLVVADSTEEALGAAIQELAAPSRFAAQRLRIVNTGIRAKNNPRGACLKKGR